MNWFDIIVGLFLLYGFYKGFKSGLIIELTSLLGLILGVVGAYYLSKEHGLYIGQWLDWEEQYLRITTFLISFFIIMILVALIGRFITSVINFVALSFFNKVAGGFFGILKTALLISILLILFNVINDNYNLVSKDKLESSITYPYLSSFSDYISEKYTEMKDEHQDVLDKLPKVFE